MSSWLIGQRYGFGAARIRLCAEPHPGASGAWTLREDVRGARRELARRGARGALGVLPALAMGAVVLMAPALAMLQWRGADSDIELVVATTAPKTSAPPEAPPAKPPPAPSSTAPWGYRST